jgi:predicted RNA binding protein YcfA (HicA-like mRNA interferase family)
VLGSEATGWLTERGVHARLRHRDGSVVLVGGWPADARDPAVSSVDGSGVV